MDIARLDPDLIPNGTIVLVDAAEVRSHFEDRYVGSVVMEQLKTADLLIVNKTDLVEEEELFRLETWLEEVAPSVTRLKTSGAKVALPVIFGELRNSESISSLSSQNVHTHFSSISLQAPVPVERVSFEHWKSQLSSSVIRGKGIIRFNNNPEIVWIWQKVGRSEILQQMKSIKFSGISKVSLIGTVEMPSVSQIGYPEGFTLLY
jgi:G3E family GTPase